MCLGFSIRVQVVVLWEFDWLAWELVGSRSRFGSSCYLCGGAARGVVLIVWNSIEVELVRLAGSSSSYEDAVELLFVARSILAELLLFKFLNSFLCQGSAVNEPTPRTAVEVAR
ncbi:hypothetical protein Droror1_Dr00025730 [Drosera rotundifolia]